jgi:hypothetical protein
VVTDTEAGWDCVLGVFRDKGEADAYALAFNKGTDYPAHVHEQTIQ